MFPARDVERGSCLNLSTSTMVRVPTKNAISINGDYAMTRDTGCSTTASSHVRVLYVVK